MSASTLQTPSRSLLELHASLSSLPLDWCARIEGTDKIQLCKLGSCQEVVNCSQPTYISHCITVESDGSWKVFVSSCHIEHENAAILSDIPNKLDHGTVMKLISILDSVNVCHGYPKKEYIDMATARRDVFKGKDGGVRARVDSSHPVIMEGEIYHSTIRTVGCAVLSKTPLCNQCKEYAPFLRTAYSRWLKKPKEVSKFTNNRFLTSPQKSDKLKRLQETVSQGRKERIAVNPFGLGIVINLKDATVF